ncbi:hypothetical protein UFOVP1254_60 [uncultured Caudovirales phage]|uniref:Uncharacterized protein n=1 Tax=uncultured Caudovirales phage TaxID=2100421 RepID=A0A6J5RBR7_9CAUD|nr:hypothetical protein UFOVP1254_60 [uncultured Caudovirales phage]
MKSLKEDVLYIFVLVVALRSAAVLYGMYRSKAECELRGGGISVRATLGGNVCPDARNMV